MSARIGVKGLQVAEDFRRALASSNNSDAVGLLRLGKNLGYKLGILRRVNDPGVIDGEDLRNLGLSSESKHDVLGSVGGDRTSANIAATDGEDLNSGFGSGLRGDGNDFMVVLDNIIKVRGAPSEVVLELNAGGQEGIEVDKVDQPIVLMKVIEESEARPGIPESSKILKERNLHLRAREEHAGMPGEASLLLEEKNAGGAGFGTNLATGSKPVVHGDSN